MTLSSRDTVVATVVGAVLFAAYAVGACATIYVGDSGELVAAVHVLGIPHPSGYPVYVLAGKLWTLLLPIGSVAWRMSLFSALCAAAACAVMFRLCRSLGLHAVAALTAALLLGFSPSFWAEANVQRVYGLGALFVLLATAAACRWYRERRGARLALAFFLCGLGATNHLFMVAYAFAFAAFVMVTDPSVLRRGRGIAGASAAFALGLLPYLYLPLRSRADPPLDWGDPETLGRFFDVVVRRDFWQRAWLETPADLWAIAADYAVGFARELTWAGVLLALVGAAAGRRRRWPVSLALMVMAVNLAALAVHGSRSDIFIWHRYYIPSYAMAALLAGLGCHVVLERLPRRLRWLPLAVPLFLVVTGWREFDRSRYRIAEDFAISVLRSLPPGAHLVAGDDNVLFTLMYLQMVEQQRPDVDLILQGVGGAPLAPLRFDPEVEPLFFTHHPNWDLPGLEIVPQGVVFRAWRAGTPPPEVSLPELWLDGERDPRVSKDYLTRNLIGHFHYMLGVTFEQGDWPRARAELIAAARAAPQNDVLFYNLGLIYRRNGLLDDAVRAFRRSDAINPRHLPGPSRARAADRLAEVEAERERVQRLERSLAGDGTLPEATAEAAAYHRRIADLLALRGEVSAARGHRLRALEIEAAGQAPRGGTRSPSAFSDRPAGPGHEIGTAPPPGSP